MPRRYDFEKFGKTDNDFLEQRRYGERELDEYQYFGKGFDWPAPQFEYNPKIDLFYKNDTVDTIFDWCSNNLEDAWHWGETWCNNGRSLAIFVWFETMYDLKKFEYEWVDTHFEIAYGHPSKVKPNA